ncbi:MAG: hypothetical protein J7L47_08820 [Candidatus Odinarchaeota archaeon]|nr:hypothetical protein [Candidatus Odinarchaeota archaeon]
MIGMKAFGMSIMVLTAPFWTFLIGAVILQFAGGIELVKIVFTPAMNADLFLITMYIMVLLKSAESAVNFVILLLNSYAGTKLDYWNLDPMIDQIVDLFRAWAGI